MAFRTLFRMMKKRDNNEPKQKRQWSTLHKVAMFTLNFWVMCDVLYSHIMSTVDNAGFLVVEKDEANTFFAQTSAPFRPLLPRVECDFLDWDSCDPKKKKQEPKSPQEDTQKTAWEEMWAFMKTWYDTEKESPEEPEDKIPTIRRLLGPSQLR